MQIKMFIQTGPRLVSM